LILVCYLHCIFNQPKVMQEYISQ
jgi:hypothetical protein